MYHIGYIYDTHRKLLEQGTDLLYIQSLRGRSGAKTTEIYTHITARGFDKIKSLLGNLDF